MLTSDVLLKIEEIGSQSKSSDITIIWDDLVKVSGSDEPVYQTSGFSRYLDRFSSKGDQVRVFSIRNESDGRIIGILPVRVYGYKIPFNFGSKVFRTPDSWMVCANVLGSLPAIEANDKTRASILLELMNAIPECKLILLQSLRRDNGLFDQLEEINRLVNKFRIYPLNGWRDCHTIIIPKTFDCYLQQFGRKKRYNINRQIRLLKEYGGGLLDLLRIDKVEQVTTLIDGLNDLCSDGVANIGLPREKYESMAEEGLLLSYVLKCGGVTCAVVAGLKANGVFNLPEILVAKEFQEFSPGATAIHLIVEDLIKQSFFYKIDMGFGSPKYSNSSTNTVVTRSHVIIFRNELFLKLIFFSHRLFSFASVKLKNFLKLIRASV